MKFDTNDYLQWYIPRMRRGDGAVNLHSSGVVPISPDYFAAGEGNPWEATAGFETKLAAWLGVAADEVAFTPGATGGTLLALLTLGRPGGKVVVEAPIYEPMLRQAARLHRVERLTRTFESGWRLPLDEARRVVDADTAVVMITEPNNPGGTLSPREDVLVLADVCAQAGAWLLINEVYRGYAQTESYHGARDNIVVVSSLSKYLGAYWARLGWLSASPDLVQRFHAAHANLSMPAAPSAAVGIALLDDAERLGAQARQIAAAGAEVVHAWVERTPGLAWHRPDGPGFGAVRLPEGTDDVAFAEALHDRHGVLAVPGAFFDAPGTLRITWLQAGDRLQEGLDLIAAALR